MADRPRSRSPSPRSRSRSPRSTAQREISRAQSHRSRSRGASSDSKLWSALGAADCSEYKRRYSSKSPPASRVNLRGYSIDFIRDEITHISEQGDRTTKKLDKDTKDKLERICSADPKIKQFCGGPYLVQSDYADMEQIDEIFKNLPPKGLPKGHPKGGSRRRPSRKSKRVLRRKSRSTRRR